MACNDSKIAMIAMTTKQRVIMAQPIDGCRCEWRHMPKDLSMRLVVLEVHEGEEPFIVTIYET
jgi:hypothetical protein